MDSVSVSGGIYLLLVRVPRHRVIEIGAMGQRLFHRGYYGYIGAARRGLRARLDRHRSALKKLHWHIDYLLQYGEIEAIVYSICSRDGECLLANQLSNFLPYVPGFGSSDCRCASHLFFSPRRKILARVGCESFRSIGLIPRLYWKKPSIDALKRAWMGWSARMVKNAEN
jgi:Uri superfamily endonuclease